MEEPMEVEATVREEECGDGVEGADSDEGVIERDNFAVESRHENKGGAFTTGIDIFGVEERRRMQERAKRFGLSERDGVEDEEELYSSMGVVEDNENSKHIRLNVLHMRGTEEMSTKDVFKYFEHYPPAAIEWINDVSCNVVWLDNVSAARALLGLSKRIIGLPDHLESEAKGKYTHEDNLIEVGDPKSESTIHLKDVECPLPPGLWRKGHDSPKSKGIFLRFATRNDKKQPRAEKMSKYYKKYGNPNFGGMRGILTETRKRQYKQIRITKSRGASENGNEEESERAKNPWGELSENWGAHEDVEDNYIRGGQSERSERGNVKGRLGLKPPLLGREAERPEVEVEVSLSEDSESSDSEEEWARRSKIPRMRMHADDEEEKVKKKKLKLMTKKIQEESADLRSRLGRRKPHPIYREDIQVIVTNNPEKYRSRKAREEPEELEEEAEEEVEEQEEEEDEMDEEREEGEWEDVEEEESESSSSDSDISEKEIQGPKGSVIKVVPRSKPRVASTVWARLNVKGQSDNSPVDSGNSRKLRGDLRSRLGHQKRERSPLRIEVKNEKYKKRDESD